MPLSVTVARVMAAEKSRKVRMAPAPVTGAGASKCLRYTQARSHADGSQFRQDSGTTVCGSVTGASALSSKPGRSLPAAAAPNSQPVLNGTVFAAGPPRVSRPATAPPGPAAATAARHGHDAA